MAATYIGNILKYIDATMVQYGCMMDAAQFVASTCIRQSCTQVLLIVSSIRLKSFTILLIILVLKLYSSDHSQTDVVPDFYQFGRG